MKKFLAVNKKLAAEGKKSQFIVKTQNNRPTLENGGLWWELGELLRSQGFYVKRMRAGDFVITELK